jgi:hypothetical protein
MDRIDFDHLPTRNHELSCASCDHSSYHGTTTGEYLWCETHKCIAKERCGDFEYAPGSDEFE